MLQRILVRDPTKRATLEELLSTAWVTNNYTESIRLQEVTVFKHGFGNIDKLIKSKLTSGKSSGEVKYVRPKTLENDDLDVMSCILE